MSKRVLWIDPGEKCGWARALVDDAGNWTELRHGITPWRKFVLALYKVQLTSAESELEAGRWPVPYDLIGYEVFRLYRSHALQQIGSDMQTSQCIGAIRLIGWLSGARIASQGASVKRAARASSPAWLKDYLAKFPKSHDEAHDEDALLHLWQWTFARHDVDPTTHNAQMDLSAKVTIDQGGKDAA